MSKRKASLAPVVRTKKPALETVHRLVYESDIDDEKMLVRQINRHLAVLEGEYEFLFGQFPSRVDITQIDPYKKRISFTFCRFKLPSLAKPKLALLSLEEKFYTWSEVSTLLLQLSAAARKRILREVQRQLGHQETSILHLYQACVELVKQLDADYPNKWRKDGVMVNNESSITGGTSLRWKGSYNENSVIPTTGYTEFAEMLVSFLRLLN